MSTSTTTIGLLAPLCLLFLTGQSTVYRCVDPVTNVTKFSDTRCQAHEQGSSRTVRPNSIDTQGSREQALRHEIRQLQGQLREQEARSYSAQSPTGMTQPDLQSQRIDTRECELARRAYEIESGSMSKSKSSVEMKREAMYGACGMREPDRTEINVRNDRYDAPAQDDERRRGPVVITNCDQGGCWDTRGGRYNRGAGDTHFGPNGVVCQMMGGQMICP